MMKINNLAVSCAALTMIACSPTVETTMEDPITYPETRKDNVERDYFGVKVAEPYAWLENDTSAETGTWVKAQNEVSQSYLSRIPFRDQIKDRMTELFDYERLSAPMQVGEYFFFYKNDGLQNQPVIYFQKGKDAEPQVFIDPNAMSAGGTISISLLEASPDDKYIAYSQSEAGSDWSKIYIREIATNTQLSDELVWVKFSGASWTEEGFYYSRYPAPAQGQELSGDNKDHSIYFHKLGTPQSEDKLFYRNAESPNLYHYGSVTEDEEYFVMYAASGTDGFETFIKNLKSDGPLTKICSGYSNKTTILDHKKGKLIARTDIGAPNYRVVNIDPKNYAQEEWKDIIPEREITLSNVSTGGGYLFAEYLKDATSVISQFDYDGKLVRHIELPAPGSAGGFGGKVEQESVFYSFTSFTYPSTIFELDVKSGESTVFAAPDVKFDPNAYESHQEWVVSKDGTRLPIFIVHKKGIKRDGNNTTLLYAYGGFNVSLGPSFSAANICFLENGGVYVLAILRGGGEYGEKWHQMGMKEKKQNVFDDFIASAEYLISEKYTSPEKLAIRGGSNGGLLVGAVMTQRPELFAVALPAVGVMDMLRFQKFTVGKGWVPEYGSADSSKAEFDYLYAYSPLHNLKDGVVYPSTMVTTGDHDDRVVPAHSFKFAARLQEAHAGENPVLIRIETEAGHGAGKPISKVIDEQADIVAFTLYETGVRELKPAESPVAK